MQVRARPLVWGLATLALLIGGLMLWQSNSPSAPDLAPPVATAAVGTKPFVRSMLDTVPDGNLQGLQAGATDASSGPLAYGELKRLFDYYLSAMGEQSIEGITAHLRGELERRLPPAQAKRAQRLLDLYIAFKRELLVLESKPELSGNAVQAIRARMLAMQDLRARYFSAEETQGMFGFDDAYDMDAVARLEVSQNPALNAEQKKQQLAALDTAMSPVLREAREASLVVVRVEQQAQELRAKGASEDDIYRMRAKAFDPEAAARLADVDREETIWKARIAQYQEQRSKVLQSNAQASESERQAAVLQLQQSLFSQPELPRLVAYD
jgi:lipase chaperone LimK